jgi:hypothetical protein
VLHRAISIIALLATPLMYPPYVYGLRACMSLYPTDLWIHCDTMSTP